MKQQIQESNFSIRALNSFKQFSIKSLEDIKYLSNEQLLKIGFGRKTINEIRNYETANTRVNRAS